MIAKIAALIIMAASFTLYLVFTQKKHSISETFFNRKGVKRIMFILMMAGISWPMYLFLYDYAPVTILQWTGYYFMIFGAFLIFVVGCFADFKRSEPEMWLHVIPSYGGIFLCLSGLPMLYGWWFLTPLALFLSLATASKWWWHVKNLTYWHEIQAFICVWCGLAVATILKLMF